MRSTDRGFDTGAKPGPAPGKTDLKSVKPRINEAGSDEVLNLAFVWLCKQRKDRTTPIPAMFGTCAFAGPS